MAAQDEGMRFLVGFGTRPEVIKLAPVILELKKRGESVDLLSTGQHTDLLQDVKELIPPIDLTLECGKLDMQDQLRRIIGFSMEGYECAIVQGDTTSALGIALSAFYQKVPLAHVEAGLRSYNKWGPWPEECHRIMIDSVADYLYYPTFKDKYVAGKEFENRLYSIVGNTCIDMLRLYNNAHGIKVTDEGTVLVTIHRREVAGERMRTIFQAINDLAEAYPELTFNWPLHPNPAVQSCRPLLTAGNINVWPPLSYGSMVREMARCKLIVTDSGGLQEEGPYLGKRVVVLRDETERMEGVVCGACVLGGTQRERITRAFHAALMAGPFVGVQPYGNGHAAEKIVNHLLGNL